MQIPISVMTVTQTLFNLQNISLTLKSKINTPSEYFETHSMSVISMVHSVRALAVFFCLFMQTTALYLSLASWWWDYIYTTTGSCTKTFAQTFLNLLLRDSSLFFFIHDPFHLYKPQYVQAYTKQWCCFNSEHYYNRTILSCMPVYI